MRIDYERLLIVLSLDALVWFAYSVIRWLWLDI